MTNTQYETILAVLADTVKEQGDTIGFQKLRIELLESKIKEAEKHIRKDVE